MPKKYDPRLEAEKRIEKKKEELVDLERKVAECKASISAFEEAIKLYAKPEMEESRPANRTLRAGMIRDVRDFLKKAGNPVVVERILQGIGKEASQKNKRNLCSQLNRYVSMGEFFTRPEPNTFGLTEFNDNDEMDGDLTDDVLSFAEGNKDDLPF